MNHTSTQPTSLSDLSHMFGRLQHRPRVAVVSPHDSHTQQVVDRCLRDRLAEFTLICSRPDSWADDIALQHGDCVTVCQTPDQDAAAARAVEEVRAGRADVVMKGEINTDNLLRAVLNKEHGLLPAGKVLTHLTAAEIPSYRKLLFFSDAAVIPQPGLEQMQAIIAYDTRILRRLGINPIKVATIHFTEKVNEKFPHTLYYKTLSEEAAEGKYGEGVEIDGPMDVKSACDSHSAEMKHIAGGVSGDADLLLFPNLVAANTFYKTISCFSGATMAGMLCGTTAPIVIPSRADSAESKFYSLALACIARQ